MVQRQLMKRSLPNYETITGGLEPSKVKADPFLGKWFMERVPDDIIKRVEGCSTPWLELSGGENLWPEEKKFFEVARSAALAQTKMIFEDQGLATRESSKPSRLYEGEKLLRRLLAAGYFKPGSEDLETLLNSTDAKGRREIEDVIEKDTKARARHPSTDWKEKDPEIIEHEILQDKERLFLITTWLRWGEEGFPGLCFFKLKDVVTVMETVFPRTRTENAHKRYGERMIERLGLKFFNHNRPLILEATPQTGGYIQVRYQGLKPFRFDRNSEEEPSEKRRTNKVLLPGLKLFGEPIYPASK